MICVKLVYAWGMVEGPGETTSSELVSLGEEGVDSGPTIVFWGIPLPDSRHSQIIFGHIRSPLSCF